MKTPHLFSVLTIIFFSALPITANSASSPAPADPDLTPDARKLLTYLQSINGTKTLAGISNWRDTSWRVAYEITGRAPAVCAWDVSGWNSPTWGPSYCLVLQGYIDASRSWWQDKGGIVTLQWHWKKPGDPNGSAWVGDNKSGPFDISRAVTPGTAEHTAVMDDLRRTADYLEQLSKAGVPVLWRPLHEIDGGWFWWTDGNHPENTAALWRMMFNYFVKERKLHNLIWVYSTGVAATGTPANATLDQEIAQRKRFYPGDKYVDFAGIDIYPGGRWGSVTTDTYSKGYEIMSQVAPGKMQALTESAAIPNPDMLEKIGPSWLYVVPWFATGDQNPLSWMRLTYNHPHMVTLDGLPALTAHNVAPNVQLIEPADGAQIDKGRITIKARASDRNRNLKSVQFFLLPGAWKNWEMCEDSDIEKSLAKATRLGDGKFGSGDACMFVWANAPAGLYNLVAVARDSEGKISCSSIARLTVGLKNLARGGPTQASSDVKNAGNAVDGDFYSAWSGDKNGQQWLSVDLGTEQRISGAVTSWWKAYAKTFAIQVSLDDKTWKEVHRTTQTIEWRGDSEILRFDPVKARYVRLLCLEPGTTWGGYTLRELAVFTSIPQ